MIPEHLNIAELFAARAEKFRAQPFLRVASSVAHAYCIDARDYSYGEVLDLTCQMQRHYRAQGVGRGTVVGLALKNRPEFFFHFLALNGLGAQVVALAVEMVDPELSYLIAHSEMVLLTCLPEDRARFQKLASDLTIVTLDRFSSVEVEPLETVGGYDDIAAVLYTSGTTGRPKGCMLSNAYFLHIGKFYPSIGGYCHFSAGQERLITPLPVTHMNALACSFMASIETGSCLIQLDRFHPSQWWDTVRESRATIMHYLGVMPAMLLKAPPADDDFSDQIKFAFGAGCDPRHHANFENRFKIKLLEAWAMTETGAGAWIMAAHEPRHVGTRCFGQKPDGLEVKLLQEDAADPHQGELLVRRAGSRPRQFFFSGYLKDQAATDEAWHDDWFHTGDIVRMDQEGNFYFVDRKKNIIRRSGENISASEVEAVLLRHPDVANCVVVPVKDDLRGEEVSALIIPHDHTKSTTLAHELFAFCQEALSYYKIPAYFAIVDEIAVTASQKVKRQDARLQAEALLGEGKMENLAQLKKSPHRSKSV